MNNQLTVNYSSMLQFRDVYLEDSFVLDILAEQKRIEFSLEAVLTENHPLYKEPLENESYCYQKAKLIFTDFDSAEWLEKNNNCFTDASDEIDYGNIDFFNIGKGFFDLGGDWGHLAIKDGVAKLVF